MRPRGGGSGGSSGEEGVPRGGGWGGEGRGRQRGARRVDFVFFGEAIKQVDEATARGFEPLRAEPNGFRVHLLSRSDTLSVGNSEPEVA